MIITHQITHQTRLDYQPLGSRNTSVHEPTHQTSESQQIVLEGIMNSIHHEQQAGTNVGYWCRPTL